MPAKYLFGSEPEPWELISSRILYQHGFAQVQEDLLAHPRDGHHKKYFFLRSPVESVATLPITDNGMVILTRQYRHPVGRVIYDLPAGAMNPKEDPHSAAARELEEETGFRAARWHKLAYFNQYPGAIQMGTHVFAALALTPGEQHLEQDEELSVVKIPFDEAMDLALDNKLIDGALLIALLLAAQKGLAPSGEPPGIKT